MRIVLDVTATAGNRIEGTASWVNGGKPIPFTGWLALMRLFEDASGPQEEKAAVHHQEVVNYRADGLPGSAGGP
jgi:hypothetical protein